MIQNKMGKLALLLGISICSVASTLAETLSVEYKSFYSHVKQLDKDELDALQFAFGFIDVRTKSLCKINEARISTDKKQIPLEVSAENRFTIPSEKALRLANAIVIVDLELAANLCDMSVQLETKPEYLKQAYTQQDLLTLNSQYEIFFDNMGGFMSFMMPDVEGIKLVFSDNANHTLENGLMINNGVLTLKTQELEQLKTLSLPNKPLRITAVTSE